ncbi:hypothetical protein HDU97_002484 [Phlyctochytrium planicorne]|nr:hypothetical protein HDU97_002484 [Phlyctochytrium planicorne]
MHSSKLVLVLIATIAASVWAQDAIGTDLIDPSPLFKNVRTGQICGAWVSRDNGVVRYNQFECQGGDKCSRAANAQAGICVKTLLPASSQTTVDGSCGVALVSSNTTIPSILYTNCLDGEACVMTKGDVIGNCQKKSGANPIPAFKEEHSLAQLNEVCGQWLTSGKFNNAQCRSGLYCSITTQFTGTCQASPPIVYRQYNTGYFCGYSAYPGFYYICEQNDCVFFDKSSLNGFCLSRSQTV